METRIDALRNQFKRLRVANFLVNRLGNIRYLCGYTGSNGILLVTNQDAYFITDGRYTNQAHRQVKDAQVFIYSGGGGHAECFVRELSTNKEIKVRGRIGIEAGVLTVDFYQELRRAFPKSLMVETTDVVDDIAAVKDASEIAKIRKAVGITDKVFREVLPLIKPGVSERDIAAEISYRHHKHGAEKDSFESIVASGPRSALPHGIASARKIRKGEFVTLDFGCVYDGYCSDMTRTVVVGKASAEQKKMYKVIQEAQQRAIDAVRAGVKAADVDKVARKSITDAGYGKYFTHGLGHGLGLWDRLKQVHAKPVLAASSKAKLVAGHVVTVEPGIYLPRIGGVRIEDDVVVTDNGALVLTKSPKKLIEL